MSILSIVTLFLLEIEMYLEYFTNFKKVLVNLLIDLKVLYISY